MDKVISCIVLAAGAGRRRGYKENKIFIPLGRFSIIQRTLQNVANVDGLNEIILVVAEGDREYMTNIFRSWSWLFPYTSYWVEKYGKIL